MKRFPLLTAIATMCIVSFGAVYAASADYTDGQKLFAQKNYKAAAAKFEAAMKATPRDANTIYYCALANQMCSNRARARQLYEYIVSGFGGSQVANMASSALSQLGGAPPTAGAGGSSGGASSEPSPGRGGRIATGYITVQSTDEFRVPFQRGRGGAGVYLDGQINGQSIRFHLDTGASSTAIGANHMEALGYGRAAQGQKFEIHGVGDREKVQGWRQTVTLKIGQAYIRDFPVAVQDHMEGDPLLGQDFLSLFETDIDPEKMECVFRKKGSRNNNANRPQPRGTIDVPYNNGGGGHIIVTAEVNGRPYEMYFDTGADSVCFTMNDLKKLGLEIPAGAREGISRGVSGESRTWSFTVPKFKLGKIQKEDFEVSVVESSKMDKPLLGQSFFGEYKHKVDPANKVIHFYQAQ